MKFFATSIDITHWSYFENWDPEIISTKEHCGLQESEDSNVGTFTNFHKMISSIFSSYLFDVFEIWIWKSKSRCIY